MSLQRKDRVLTHKRQKTSKIRQQKNIREESTPKEVLVLKQT